MTLIGSKNEQPNAVQNMKFPVNDFVIKCEKFHGRLWIGSHLPKKSLTENFKFCVMKFATEIPKNIPFVLYLIFRCCRSASSPRVSSFTENV